MSQPVGIIGVGAMGLAVTERLVAAGFAVAGFRRGPMAAFEAAGGQAMASAAAVARATEPLILLLPDDAALAEVMAGIGDYLRAGQTVLCLGTHRLPAKVSALAMAEARGAALLDGEISGTPGMVRAGLASVLLAGDPAAAARARPVLAGFARAVTDCGAFGNAARMKLVTNYLVGVHTLAAADALRLGEQLGLAPAAVVAALAPSAAGSTMLAVRGPMMATGAYDAGGMAGFMRFFELLREAGGSSALLDFVEASFGRAVSNGYAAHDIAAIYLALGPT